jgi:Glycosyl hydrolase family 79 C-terminal beta domain
VLLSLARLGLGERRFDGELCLDDGLATKRCGAPLMVRTRLERRTDGRRPARLRSLFVVLALVLSVVVVGGVRVISFARGRGGESGAGSGRVVAVPAASPSTAVVIGVDPAAAGRVIPAGFLGLSFEYWALENYAGRDPGAVNPVLVRLVRNLVSAGAGVLRIGGVTTDKTWWPVAGVSRPPGVNYTLSRRRLLVARALAQAVGARLILGVNFEADSRVLAGAQTRAMLDVVGRSRIEAFELGNEPDLYAGLPWYTRDGRGIPGRPAGWDFATLNQDYQRVAAAMGSVPLAGPSIGALSWMADLSPFLASEPGVDLVTLHRYPLQGCTVAPGSPKYPTIAHLLSPTASAGLAGTLVPYVAIAHAHGLRVRNDEMNSISCGSVRGVANTFASALWSLDALFEMANVGVDGVNIHTAPGYDDQLFAFTRVNSRWRAVVEPEYYGLLMFAQAAPAGSRMLPVTGATGTLRAWATQSPTGRIRVVLINDDTAHPQSGVIRTPGAGGTATLARLQAPGARSTSGVTLAGQSFGDQTSTGRFTGPRDTVALHQVAEAYAVRLPAGSAAMLTLR